MKLPSFTVLVSGAFLAYIAHSMWTLYNLFYPPQCVAGKESKCINPFPVPESVKLWVYTSRQSSHSRTSDLTLVKTFEDISLSEESEIELNVSIPLKTRKNGTLYAHAYLAPGDPFSSKWHSVASSKLTTYMTPQAQSFSLVGNNGENETATEKVDRARVISHWRSRLTVSVMNDVISLNAQQMPPELYRFIRVFEGKYLPILYVDEVSNRIKHLMPLNESAKVMPLTIAYRPISVGKLRLWVNMQESMKMLHGLGFTEKDTDEVKGIFADTNFYLLLLTFAVAAFHMLFDFLAFKNDISYWRNRDSMVGLSTRTVVWRSVSTIIIFFYLLDEETSYLVLIPAGIGTVIELWKVKKAFKISIKWQGIIPKFEFGLQTDKEAETQQFDSQAMKYLSYVLYPLCIGGAVYSLLYTPHKSWYSWCIQSLVNGVYAFGFLFMLPQLFVNYKLKSVAHLPWRAFMYKAFNTFIDDVFAFIITMPTAHRLACFRDDVVFLVYLYQRWLYPVDRTRVNEYGQSFEESSKKGESKKTK